MKIKKFKKPFKHIIIENFLEESKLKKLEKILSKLEYEKSECDLYEFKRTQDFRNIDISKSIINLFLEKISLFEKEFKIQLNKNKLSSHSLILEKTNYLLVHDDLVQKRKIAFILNFSNFKEEMGGALILYEEDFKISKKIYPKRGNLIAFEVSKKSFHRIEEVKQNKKRLSISGWFY